MTNTGKITTAFILGTSIGALLGLFLAPHSGRTTRNTIMRKAKKTGDALAKEYQTAKRAVGLAVHSQEE